MPPTDALVFVPIDSTAAIEQLIEIAFDHALLLSHEEATPVEAGRWKILATKAQVELQVLRSWASRAKQHERGEKPKGA